jgi:hypothetical protein
MGTCPPKKSKKLLRSTPGRGKWSDVKRAMQNGFRKLSEKEVT